MKCEKTLITTSAVSRKVVVTCGIRGRAGVDATGSLPDIIAVVARANTINQDDPEYAGTDVGDLATLFTTG